MGGGKILKTSADKFFVLPSRLEMKRLLHSLTLIYEEHSQLSLQFLFSQWQRNIHLSLTRASRLSFRAIGEVRTQNLEFFYTSY